MKHHRIFKAEPVTPLLGIADQMDTATRRAFLDAIRAIQDVIDVDELARLIERGELELALQMVDQAFEQTNALRGVTDQLRAAVVAGAVQAAGMASALPAIGRYDVRFDILNPRTAEWLRLYEFRLIRELTDDTRQAVRQAIVEGVNAGRNPLTVARAVRDTIGLTARQEATVANYRRLLETADRQALERALRDRRFDSTVRRILQGQTVPPDRIDAMVERYRQRMLLRRSQTIARTEAIRAVQAGQHDMWRQMVEQGLVRAEDIVREWIYTHDGRVRDAHRLIPSMNPTGVRGLATPFESILGPILFPGDPAALPENTINCFLPGTEIVGDIVAASKAAYSGPVCELKTLGGARLSVTLNHPIMTERGLVPANEIREGDYLLTAGVQVKDTRRIGDDDAQTVPTMVEQIFSTLSQLYTTLTRRVTAVDFHGDGRSIEGDIEIVIAHRMLARNRVAVQTKPLQQFALIESDSMVGRSAHGYGTRSDAFRRINLAASRGVGALHLAAHQLRVLFNRLPLDPFRFGTTPQLDATFKKMAGQSLSRNTNSVGYGLEGMTRTIARDPVVNIRQYKFCGHVYDLQSTSGLVLAGGLITSNCRCAVLFRIEPESTL